MNADKRGREIKALSIRQPWAALIVLGIKQFEFRTWSTEYRGPLLIHASQKFDQEGLIHLIRHCVSMERKPELYDRGCIIGICELIACRRLIRKDIDFKTAQMGGAPGLFAWQLDNPRILPMFKCRGSLGLWTPSEWIAHRRRGK